MDGRRRCGRAHAALRDRHCGRDIALGIGTAAAIGVERGDRRDVERRPDFGTNEAFGSGGPARHGDGLDHRGGALRIGRADRSHPFHLHRRTITGTKTGEVRQQGGKDDQQFQDARCSRFLPHDSRAAVPQPRVVRRSDSAQ